MLSIPRLFKLEPTSSFVWMDQLTLLTSSEWIKVKGLRLRERKVKVKERETKCS